MVTGRFLHDAGKHELAHDQPRGPCTCSGLPATTAPKATAHLVRRSVPSQQRGLAKRDVPEAVRLYESGLTLMEVGQQFGVSEKAVRSAVAAEGVAIRPRGRHPAHETARPARIPVRSRSRPAVNCSRSSCVRNSAAVLWRNG